RSETTSKYLSLPAQRASSEPAAATAAGGVRNSLKVYWTLPVSTYFFLNSGKTVSWNSAQCGQVREAYSTTFTGALGSPSVMSPVMEFAEPPAPLAWPQPTRAKVAAAMARVRRVKFGMAKALRS